MKKRIVSSFLGILFVIVAQAQAQWIPIEYMISGNDTVTGNQTRSIKGGFLNEIYVCTDLGLFMSIDNGDYWMNITSGVEALQGEKISSVLVAGGGDLYVGTDRSLFKCSNGGLLWSELAVLPDSAKFWDIVESSNGTIVAAYESASGSGAAYSNNYGDTWNLSSGISSEVRSFLRDGSNLFLSGVSNGVYKSTDNGHTFTAGAGFPENPGIWGVQRLGSKLFASSVAGKGLFSSSDEGETWDSTATEYFADAFCQIFAMVSNGAVLITANDGAATVGCNTAFRISVDSGITWSNFEGGLDLSAGHYFPHLGKSNNGNCIFTIRNNGSEMYRYGDCTGMGLNEKTANKDILLYPNPAKDKIQLQLPANEKLQQVKIYNTLGQLCRVATDNNTIDIEFLPQGIYYLKVQTKNRELTSRFVKE